MLNKKQQAYIDLLFATSGAGLFPAMTEYGSCSYRTDAGRGCAIGIAIPKSRYRKSFEGQSIKNLPLQLLEYLEKKTGFPLSFLEEVQMEHDSMADSGGWDHEEFVREINLHLDGLKEGWYK